MAIANAVGGKLCFAGMIAATTLLVAPRTTLARSVRMRSALAPTSADANARGQVGLGVRGSDGVFDVKASRLDRSRGYDVVVGGVKVGDLQTNGSGSGRLRFRSQPRSKDRVLGFDPRGKSITLRNGAGNDVLVGSLPDDGTDPAATACCVPDDGGGAECEDLTADACAAAGGSPTQATSCMPDPCAATPSSTAVVCCTNETEDDGSETECESEDSATDCTADGGTVVEATACDPNPCAPTPPPAGDVVACCVAGDEHAECEDRTAEACAAENGTVVAGTTCDADPCGAGSSDGNGDGSDDGDGGQGGGGDGGED